MDKLTYMPKDIAQNLEYILTNKYTLYIYKLRKCRRLKV